MRTEVPIFQKCCFCVPLRCGLLVWAYFKLILACLLLAYYSYILHYVIHLFVIHKDNILIKNIVIFSVMVSTLVIDIVIHTIFIVGAHKKNVMFLKVFYFYALTLLGISLFLGVVSIDLMIKNVVNQHTAEYLGRLFVVKTIAMFISLLVQTYIILLVRSEIIKLNKIGLFRRVSKAGEAELILQGHDTFVKKEKSATNHDNQMEFGLE